VFMSMSIINVVLRLTHFLDECVNIATATMPQLKLDPALESIPDHVSEAFSSVRAALVDTRGISEEEAVIRLVQAWTAYIDAKKLQWVEQQNQNRLAVEEKEA
jgi:hypothetical protein